MASRSGSVAEAALADPPKRDITIPIGAVVTKAEAAPPQRQRVTYVTAAFAEADAARKAAFGPELLQLWPETCSPPLPAGAAGRARFAFFPPRPRAVAPAELDEASRRVAMTASGEFVDDPSHLLPWEARLSSLRSPRGPGFWAVLPERLEDLEMNTPEENDELLCAAARFGDAIACSELIEWGAKLNYVDEHGLSPLHLKNLLRGCALLCEPCPIIKVKVGGEIKEAAYAMVAQIRRAYSMPILEASGEPPWISGRGGSYQEIKEAAYAMVDQIRRAGGWKEYARQHKRVLAAFVTKCAPLPNDAAQLVVEFWCPEGGYQCN